MKHKSGKSYQARTAEPHFKNNAGAGSKGGRSFAAVSPVQQHTAKVVQRYRLGNPQSLSDDLELNSHSIRQDNPYSRKHEDLELRYSSKDGFFTGTATDFGSKNTTPRKQKPPEFKISETNQMALPITGGQHREFFATDALFHESNLKLKNAGAAVALGKQGGDIKLDEKGDPLYRIVPLMPKPGMDEQKWGKMESLSEYYCNKVVDELIGGTNRVAVLAGTLSQKEEISQGAFKHQDPTWAREFLVTPDQEKPNPGSLDKAYGNYREIPKVSYDLREEAIKKQVEHFGNVSEKYGKQNPSKRSEESQKHGLNEFALPDAGEAYMISSAPDKNYEELQRNGVPGNDYQKILWELQKVTPKIAISEQQAGDEAKSLMDSWSYHFAAVIARDNADTMTLENYNRGVETSNMIKDIFHRLFLNFEVFREDISEKLKEEGKIGGKHNHYKELITWMAKELPLKYLELENKAKEALQQALESIDTGLTEDADYYKKLLFFEMYGPGEQSFHEAYKPAVFNPLTVRIRESFAPQKEAMLEKEQKMEEKLRNGFKGAKWETKSGKKHFKRNLFSSIWEFVYRQENLLNENVSNNGALKTWRFNTITTIDSLTLPSVLMFLNESVPFKVEYKNNSLDDISMMLQQLNKMLAARKSSKQEKITSNEEQKKENKILELINLKYFYPGEELLADLVQLEKFIDAVSDAKYAL